MWQKQDDTAKETLGVSRRTNIARLNVFLLAAFMAMCANLSSALAVIKIADRDAPTEQPCRFPTCEGKVNMSFSTPHIGDPWHHAGKKVDEGFKDKLRDIKSRHKHSTINV